MEIILANYEKQADFIYDNIMIQTNLINTAKENKIKNLIFLGSVVFIQNIANNL